MENGINKKAPLNWTEGELSSFLEFMPPIKKKLYTTVGEKIQHYKCKKILDYGCGEGNQLEFLDKTLLIDLYDINDNFSLSAFNRYKMEIPLKLTT